MAEEQRLQEGHRPCANNCGFFGSPATLNLCSKCYRDHRIKEEAQAAAAAAAACSSSAFLVCSSSSAVAGGGGEAEAAAESGAVSPSSGKAAAAGPSRCASCRKRIGLTGFTCRCGATFCGTHRYPERHGCGFDFKAAGRDAIARANPVVKADKLHHKI